MLLNIWFKYLPLQDKSKDSKANPLSVKNIGGVFVVLLAGLLGSIIVAVLEFCWNSRKVYPVKCIKFSRFQITKVLRIETLLFIYVTLFKCLFLFYWVQNIKVSITCYSQTSHVVSFRKIVRRIQHEYFTFWENKITTYDS